jgi:hypothetical protein
MKTHFSEFTDSQWQFIEKIINNQRKQKYHLKRIINVTFWINTTREATLDLLVIDSQSFKAIRFVSQEIGADGGKKINGRKRTILVDKLGLPFANMWKICINGKLK